MKLQSILIKYLYIFSLGLAVIGKDIGLPINYWFQFLVGSFWIGLMLVDIMVNKKKVDGIIKDYFWFNFPVIVLIFIHGLLVSPFVTIETITIRNYSRLISNLGTFLITLCIPLAGYYFFKDKLFNVSFKVLLFANVVEIISAAVKYGIKDLLRFILFFDTTAHSMIALEDTALTLSWGAILLYYLFMVPKGEKKRKRRILLSLFFIYIGFKRIQILALILVYILGSIIYRMKDKFNKKIITILFLCVLGTSIFYLYIIKIGVLGYIATGLNINTMGRLFSYEYLSNYYDFSPFFLGYGFGFVGKLLEERHIYVWGLLHKGVHNDIMRLYMELGFIPFILFVWNDFVRIPKKLLKKYGKEAMKAFLILMSYLYISLATDNTITYLPVRYTILMISIACSSKYINCNREINNKE